jgi:hypothetical protein
MPAYYVNAEAVLPPDLLDAVSKALHGRWPAEPQNARSAFRETIARHPCMST